jgi:hypothetical protein
MQFNESAVILADENETTQPGIAQPFTTVSNAKVTIVQTVEINATLQSVWTNLCDLALFPAWFGMNEVNRPLASGPHEQNTSSFAHMFTALSPFKNNNSLAQLQKLVPLQSVTWQAQGHQMTATQTWKIQDVSKLESSIENFQPTTLVSVEISFSGMSEWYFNVMNVRSKMLTAFHEILMELRRSSE